MKYMITTALLMLMCASGCRSKEPVDPPTPDDPKPATRAEGADPAVKPGGDRPGVVRCSVCSVVVCAADYSLAGLRLDVSQLDLDGTTGANPRLRIEATSGEAVAIPVEYTALQKPFTVDDKLTGLPSPSDKDAWSSPKAELLLEYKSSKGKAIVLPTEIGKIEVKPCP